MEKYVKLNGEKIVEVRPLLPETADPDIVARFETEFLRVDVPDVNDIELMKTYVFRDGQFIQTNDFLKVEALKKELVQIQAWLAQNDWIPNKIITGEWEDTDERWRTYLADRKVYRHRFDELKEILGA